jgi:2,3-bisphosphoglycerate-independent phosphoglycerate mutase
MTTVYCIFDGFGLQEKTPNNCIALAQMPNFQSLLKNNFWTTLNADGVKVGQEDGLVGNSEVGHMNLGGLQLVPQLSYQITQASIKSFELDKTISPDQIFDPALKLTDFNSLHLVGLFSTGTIHSDLRHWLGAIESAHNSGINKIICHFITDGRDSDRKSFVQTLKDFITTIPSEIKEKIYLGSIGGRAYSMDRDNNFEKVYYGLQSMFGSSLVEKTKTLRTDYNITEYKTAKFANQSRLLVDSIETIEEYVNANYINNIFDEFIEPISYISIQEQEPIWLINFRADRMRQMIKMVCDYNHKDQHLILAMNDYGIEGDGYEFIFKSKPVTKNFSYYAELENKSQLHTAETEKYNHVTFFFNGGQDIKQKKENWELIPSNKVTNHSEIPEMKAKEVNQTVISSLGKYDYIIVNFANPDMVGHCGDIEAGIVSMEFLDQQLGLLLQAVKDGGHKMVLTADHGNMEFVGPFTRDGKELTDTEHNPSPVPLVIIDENLEINGLLSRIELFTKKNDIIYDKELLTKVLNSNNIINNSWPTKQQIPLAELPLWYAGLVAYCL